MDEDKLELEQRRSFKACVGSRSSAVVFWQGEHEDASPL